MANDAAKKRVIANRELMRKWGLIILGVNESHAPLLIKEPLATLGTRWRVTERQ